MKQYLEILPASLLVKQRTWQNIAGTMPDGSYLLIIDPSNKAQSHLMQGITRTLRERGRHVVIWRSSRV